MLGRTKKPHTDKTIILTFHGPEKNRQEAIKALSRLGYVDAGKSTSWRKAFPQYSDEELPGVSLRAARCVKGSPKLLYLKKPVFHSGIFQRWKTENGQLEKRMQSYSLIFLA